MRKKQEIEAKIIDLLIEKPIVRAADLAAKLECSKRIAYDYLEEFAAKYPDLAIYTRGTLIRLKMPEADDLPTELVVERLRKTIEVKEEVERKLKTNHLPHLERAILEGKHEEILKELEKIKKLLGLKT